MSRIIPRGGFIRPAGGFIRPASIIETKVQTATGGSVAGATVATLLIWALGVLGWGAPADAWSAQDAIAAVPSPVAAVVLPLVTAIGTFAGGYIGKHTERPDIEHGNTEPR